MDKEYVMHIAQTIKEQLHGASGSLWQQYSMTCRD